MAIYIDNNIVADTIIEAMMAFVGRLKHESFSEEKEFRFEVTKDVSAVDFFEYRTSKGKLIVPYILLKTLFASTTAQDLLTPSERKYGKIPIKKITIGPSLDFELNRHSIYRLLIKNGYKLSIDDIEASSIPYRI
jgi:hypothetical protein